MDPNLLYQQTVDCVFESVKGIFLYYHYLCHVKQKCSFEHAQNSDHPAHVQSSARPLLSIHSFCSVLDIATDKRGYPHNIFLIS